MEKSQNEALSKSLREELRALEQENVRLETELRINKEDQKLKELKREETDQKSENLKEEVKSLREGLEKETKNGNLMKKELEKIEDQFLGISRVNSDLTLKNQNLTSIIDTLRNT